MVSIGCLLASFTVLSEQHVARLEVGVGDGVRVQVRHAACGLLHEPQPTPRRPSVSHMVCRRAPGFGPGCLGCLGGSLLGGVGELEPGLQRHVRQLEREVDERPAHLVGLGLG